MMLRPWPRTLDRYATDDTYQRAAAWLAGCPDVADWGGARGYFRRFLPPTVDYTLVDGTCQAHGQVLADLRVYKIASSGILLRHVLDNTPEWRPILDNALAAFAVRMVVVTFTPPSPWTVRIDHANGYPIWQFDREDLRALMRPHLVHEEDVETSHPEHVFYLARRPQ